MASGQCRFLLVGPLLVLLLFALSDCRDGDEDDDDDSGNDGDTTDDDDDRDDVEPIIVMTFNVGTTPGLPHDLGDDGYTSEMADIADELYENSLSWNPAEEALK